METFKVTLYLLAIVTSLACTVLLFRGYSTSRVRVLMWSAICFTCLTLNNVLLFLDLIVLPEVDLRIVRHVTALVGVLFMIYGFMYDTD